MIAGCDLLRRAWIVPLAALALAACEQARTPAVAPSDDPERLKPSDVPAVADTATGGQIPAAIQGRWGLVPADCTSTKGDAKGLLEIDATTLRFYESRGALGEIAKRTDSAISAEFRFAGEGQTWSRDMTLSLEDGGKVLVRRESGDGASAAPLEYTRCT